MSTRIKEFIRNYFQLIRKNYLRDMLIVPATLISMLISFSKNPDWDWEFIPVILLIVYFCWTLYDNFISTSQITNAVNVGYSICLDQNTNKYRDALRKQIETLDEAEIGIEQITDYFRILAPDWQYYYPIKIVPSEWRKLTSDITNHFMQYSLKLPTNTQFHLFFIGPQALALGLGYTVGRGRNWSLYHYSGSNYLCVFNREEAIGERQKSGFDYIEVVDEKNNKQGEIILILSIIPEANTPLPALKGQCVKISLKEPKARISDSDFNPIAKEIMIVLDKYLRTGKKIHLFPGIPTTMAFFIGQGLMESVPVYVYNHNYKSENWECVFSTLDFN